LPSVQIQASGTEFAEWDDWIPYQQCPRQKPQELLGSGSTNALGVSCVVGVVMAKINFH